MELLGAGARQRWSLGFLVQVRWMVPEKKVGVVVGGGRGEGRGRCRKAEDGGGLSRVAVVDDCDGELMHGWLGSREEGGVGEEEDTVWDGGQRPI
jgi:hypothetical protein